MTVSKWWKLLDRGGVSQRIVTYFYCFLSVFIRGLLLLGWSLKTSYLLQRDERCGEGDSAESKFPLTENSFSKPGLTPYPQILEQRKSVSSKFRLTGKGFTGLLSNEKVFNCPVLGQFGNPCDVCCFEVIEYILTQHNIWAKRVSRRLRVKSCADLTTFETTSMVAQWKEGKLQKEHITPSVKKCVEKINQFW